MAEAEDSADKEHEPTQKRLDDARARGEIARSPDLTVAAGYGGLLLAAAVAGPGSLSALGTMCAALLGDADRMAASLREGGSAPLAALSGAFGRAVAPFFLFPAAAVLVTLIGQGALIVSAEKLAPRLSRISPLAALGHKFGRDGLFEFAKSAAKLVVVSVVLGIFVARRMGDIVLTLYQGPVLATAALMRLSVEFLFLVLLVATAVGALDYLWQTAAHLRRNRMSRQEMIDEFRLSEGDPHVKAQRRQRGQDIAMNRMLLDVPKADVVIVNPTHYAVALKWNRAGRGAPVCLAKGVDEVAARIRVRAAEAGVPIRRDPPTARALFAAVDLGEEIRPDHYRAVAAAIRFAEAMRQRARGRR